MAMEHPRRLRLGEGDGILVTPIQLRAVVRAGGAKDSEQYGRVAEAREHDGGLRQDLQAALDILWMVRQLSYRPDYGLGGLDEPCHSGRGEG